MSVRRYVDSALLVLASLIVSGASNAHRLQPARFFYEPENRALLQAVRAGMERALTFNGHYSQSYVSCGLGCGTYFFVDRWTGGVIAAPEGSPPREITLDVVARRNSDVIKVTFGPMDAVDPGCSEQYFRLLGHKFVASGRRSAIRCPR